MSSYYTPFFAVLFFICGLLAIVQGIYWLIIGKARSHWFTGLRKVSKEQNPFEYWLYVGLSIGLGILVIIIVFLGLLFIPLH